MATVAPPLLTSWSSCYAHLYTSAGKSLHCHTLSQRSAISDTHYHALPQFWSLSRTCEATILLLLMKREDGICSMDVSDLDTVR